MDNYFTTIGQRKNNLLHTGYDYSNTLLKNSMSEELYNSNETFLEFLGYLNDIVVSWVDSVKNIKTAANIALDKDEKNII